MFTTTTHEKSADFIDECRVVAACADAFNVRAIVLIEVDRVRGERHLVRIVGATLAEVIIAPGKDVAEASHHQSVRLAA